MIQDDKHDERAVEMAEDIRAYLSQQQLGADMPNITYEILALRLIDSIEHEKHLSKLAGTELNPNSLDPLSDDFDPIKAIYFLNPYSDKGIGQDNNDDFVLSQPELLTKYNEACWLVFLLIYTDDSEHTDWAFMRLLYSALGLSMPTLSWEALTESPHLLNQKLEAIGDALVQHHPKPKFGHHRAYESLSHLPMVFASYIDFINEQGGHHALFKPLTYAKASKGNLANVNKHKKDTANNFDTATQYFSYLTSLIRQNIYRFGRLSTFEYLCLLGKTGLADITPDSCYIADASGPKRGAKLLFGMLNNAQLDDHAIGLADYLDVGYQEMEIALCKWQKSPNRYIMH